MESHELKGQKMRVSQKKMLVSVLLVALGCLIPLVFQRQRPAAQNALAAQDHIESLLTKLQSPDESEVLEAKAELMDMGEGAIKPLIFLLKDLTNQTGKTLPTTSPGSLRVQANRANDAGTKSRAENAIYEILGRLRAAEAVPLLVAIMEHEEIDDMIQGMSPVMRALAEIGPAAVPQLIESIDSAKLTASASPELLVSDLTEETRQRNLAWIKGRIELRAILVLVAIGDPRAIPTLHWLQKTADNSFIETQARNAAQRIQNTTR
ncbi:MAG: hypothetical protein AABN34_24150 [Acidobacteriota bacterium]